MSWAILRISASKKWSGGPDISRSSILIISERIKCEVREKWSGISRKSKKTSKCKPLKITKTVFDLSQNNH